MAYHIVDEVMAIAEELGYEGDAPKTVSGAFDVLCETLGGEVEDPSKTIGDAIHAIAPTLIELLGGSEEK